jgi:hypothetical protein
MNTTAPAIACVRSPNGSREVRLTPQVDDRPARR